MGRARFAMIGCGVLALIFVESALTENYRYRRTARDDAKAAAILLTRSDLPSSSAVKGGRVTPDETPTTSKDACNGHVAKESDLIITGDAKSKFVDPSGVLTIESSVSVYQTAAMVLADWSRQRPLLTANCLRQVLARSATPTRLVSFRRLRSLPGYANDNYVIDVAYHLAGKPSVEFLFAVTILRRGRTEALISTQLEKVVSTAPMLALRIQTRAIAALAPRLSAS